LQGVAVVAHALSSDLEKHRSPGIIKLLPAHPGPLTRGIGPASFWMFHSRKKWFRCRNSLALRVSGADRYVRLQGRNYRMQHRRELGNL